MEIVLMGYMGCGKSTIGKQLSKALSIPFIDLDDYIEQQENSSISEIFANKGEIYFRKKEAFYLQEILQRDHKFVLSLGGGTPCYGNNNGYIANSSAQSVYLKASIPTLVERLASEKAQRPLLASLNNAQLLEYIGKHLFERAPFYEQAGIKIDINGKSVDSVAIELLTKLNRQ